MKYEIVESSSVGNFTVLEKVIALDMGVSFKKVEPYLAELQIVFVGHRHGDHFNPSTVRKAAKSRPTLRFCGGPWMVEHFLNCGVDERNIDVLEVEFEYNYGNYKIEPVQLYHDVPNYGLKIQIGKEKLFYAVDTCTLDGIEAKDFDVYLVESNYREAELQQRLEEKLDAGVFAYETRAEVTHLSREQATAWLQENMAPWSIWVPMHEHKEREAQDGMVRSTPNLGETSENAETCKMSKV